MADTPNKALRRELVAGAGMLIPGAPNALTARLIEDAGFHALLVSGAGVANTYLGVPDIGLLSVTELADHLRTIRDAVEIPIIADADTGFGNALNVGRTVNLFERAGANMIMLEDQTFPKRCGHFDGKGVISAGEMVQKIKAASDARRDADMMLLARTDALAVEGVESAIERGNAYLDAGADALFIEAPTTVDELAKLTKHAPGIHICNMVVGGKTPLLSQRELAQLGYGGIFYANAALQAALLAMKTVLTHIERDGSIEGMEEAIMSFNDRQRVVNMARFDDLARRYAFESSVAPE